MPGILDVIGGSGDKLNFHAAALIVLQQKGFIDKVTTCNVTLASQPGFRTIGCGGRDSPGARIGERRGSREGAVCRFRV